MMTLAQVPDISTEKDDNGQISVDFLLPNGVLVPMRIDFFTSLDLIKRNLWREVEKYPLHNKLKREDSYSLWFVNKVGEKEEVLDESQNLNDIRPFWPALKVVEKMGDGKIKTLDRTVNNLIGKGPQKQDSFQPAEIDFFKKRIGDLCQEITKTRRTQTAMEKFQWRHPVRLRSSLRVPVQLESRLDNGHIVIEVHWQTSENTSTKLKLSAHCTPLEAVYTCLSKRASITGGPVASKDAYILKVFGLDEYIYGDYPLIQFKYVYQCLVKNTAPQFCLVQKEKEAPPVPGRRPTQTVVPDQQRDGEYSVWNVTAPFSLTITGLSKVQLSDTVKVKLYIGLYHGNEALCEVKETGELSVQDGSCNFKAEIPFTISVADITRCCRLCFTLYAAAKKNSKDFNPVAWVNMPVYDFKGRLPRGDRVLPLWPFEALQLDDLCYPIGTVAMNSLGHDATTLSIHFPDYNIGSSIVYPPYHVVKEFAAEKMEPEGTVGSPYMKVSKLHLEQLHTALQQEELFEQDKDLLWLLRYEIRERFPHHLSKLLQAVKWSSHADVAKAVVLIESWPRLPVDYALELLDCEFPDYHVRKFAVECLNEALGDDELSQYLLQLVQALKYETYLTCPLVKFLLTRALKNEHLGHKLFWLLKSEVHNSAVMVRYSLILEAYLRVNNDHLQALVKQKDALSKLTFVNQLIKMDRYKDDQRSRDQALLDMRSVLSQKNYGKILSDLYSPLSPLFKLKDLEVQQCRIMNSKKRPLFLVWTNADPAGPDICIIYKNGDDLRQDMLTLQILQLMDHIWQAEGLDLRMNPYMCIATGPEQGLIEVVTEAQTIAFIQKWYKNNAFDKRALFEWLKTNHRTEESLDRAVEEFMLSCAGYCVATYVLGIGDRHNDNIMMKKSGQLFHIDFGHFLGNFKSKFGMKRERVPFVLTTHFVHVIKKGESNNSNFERFQETCEKAYLILRAKAHLLVSLFMMMLSSGIPQLTCRKDVDYLKETLVPHLSEADAREHFRAKFKEALKNSWTTSVNFWFHIKAKD